MEISPHAHRLCDFITKHGGEVKLGNKEFKTFCHMLYDIWEDGFAQGAGKQAILEIQGRQRFLQELRSKNT